MLPLTCNVVYVSAWSTCHEKILYVAPIFRLVLGLVPWEVQFSCKKRHFICFWYVWSWLLKSGILSKLSSKFLQGTLNDMSIILSGSHSGMCCPSQYVWQRTRLTHLPAIKPEGKTADAGTQEWIQPLPARSKDQGQARQVQWCFWDGKAVLQALGGAFWKWEEEVSGTHSCSACTAWLEHN